jgi:hypothetical protein
MGNISCDKLQTFPSSKLVLPKKGEEKPLGLTQCGVVQTKCSLFYLGQEVPAVMNQDLIGIKCILQLWPLDGREF